MPQLLEHAGFPFCHMISPIAGCFDREQQSVLKVPIGQFQERFTLVLKPYSTTIYSVIRTVQPTAQCLMQRHPNKWSLPS